MFDHRQIKIKRKELKMSVKGLADLLAIDVENLYKWEKGTKISDPDAYNKLEKWVSSKVENVPRSTFVSHDANAHPDLIQAIISLTKSNEGLVLQHNEIVQTNKAIAETNKLLAGKVVSESDTSEIPLAVESRFSDLLELIAELGTGTRWKSKQEALAVLSKLWHGKKRGVSKEGIRNG